MEDIADRLGVSKNSVSLALNGKSGVSDDLRQRVVAAATELSYGEFTAITNAESKHIAVIVPEYLHNDAFFYSDVLWAIEAQARHWRCIAINASITEAMERELILPSLLKEMNIVGILAVGVLSDAYLKRLHDMGLPIMTVDIASRGVPVGCVGTANLHGGFMATQHLIQNGHREIGFIGPVFAAQSVYERYCGYRQALEIAGLPFDEAYNITGNLGAFQLFDTIGVLEPYFEALTARPTAWFCAGDRIAIALMNILAKNGIRVPDDISVMGFDDISVAQMILPNLTTIGVDRSLMGKMAVDFLLSREENLDMININLTGRLVQRDSVKKIM